MLIIQQKHTKYKQCWDFDVFNSNCSSSCYKPGAYITHNATEPLSDITY